MTGVRRKGFSRRDFLRYSGVALGAGVLAACRRVEDTASPGGATGTGAARPPIEDEPGQLQVFDWAGYGDGFYYEEKEYRYLWKDYQTATGDTPEYIVFDNDDAGYTKVVAGNTYDVIHPCGYKYRDYVDLGVMQPWDTSLIPNFSKLNPKLMENGVLDGQQYFIPLDWGFIAPIVNLDHVDTSDKTFGLLFDERYAGKIAWVDTLNMFHTAGLYLGIPDVYNMTDEELIKTRDFLISKKPLVKYLWNNSYDFWLEFQKETVWIGYAWPDTAGYANAAGMNYEYVQPKEGFISWVCGMGLFKDTPNYYHAHEYVNSWASTKAAEFLLAWYYYGHTNEQVDLAAMPAGVVEALSLDDPSILDPPNSVRESYMPRRDLYAQYWSEVLAA